MALMQACAPGASHRPAGHCPSCARAVLPDGVLAGGHHRRGGGQHGGAPGGVLIGALGGAEARMGVRGAAVGVINWWSGLVEADNAPAAEAPGEGLNRLRRDRRGRLSRLTGRYAVPAVRSAARTAATVAVMGSRRGRGPARAHRRRPNCPWQSEPPVVVAQAVRLEAVARAAANCAFSSGEGPWWNSLRSIHENPASAET